MADITENHSELTILPENVYQYRTVSVEHLQDMQDYMDTLRQKGLFCNNEVFRSYVDSKTFNLPENFQDAKYLIAVAVHIPLTKGYVSNKGHLYEILIPPNYRVRDFTMDQLRETIAKKVISHDGYRIEDVRRNLFLKHLAVRSGLAEYGRNNICYVEGMGSMLSLFAFYTDYDFKKDNWQELRMMESCQNCRTCTNQCPTQAISDERFVINVERCLPLYNEIAGEIPVWFPAYAHNSLIGCMHCQLTCVANKEQISHTSEFEELTEAETTSILDCIHNEDMIRALCQKLKVSTPESVGQDLPVFSRNLKLLLAKS